jgi:hypothetical protein
MYFLYNKGYGGKKGPFFMTINSEFLQGDEFLLNDSVFESE